MTNMTLADLAAATCALHTTTAQVAAIHETLTGEATKARFASELVEQAATVYAIPAEDRATIVAGLTDPTTRHATEASLHRYGYVDPATSWVGTGYALIMDDVFADHDDTTDTHVVAIPARWSKDVWHHERDIDETGYRFAHWVHTTLPAVYEWDDSHPVAYVLMSARLHGTLHWGDKAVSVHGGNVTVTVDPLAHRTLTVLQP